MVVAELADESETVRLIVAFNREGMTLRTIAARLRVEGRSTKRGGRWHASTVRAVLRRVQGKDVTRAPEAA
jgi:hypothetical protein